MLKRIILKILNILGYSVSKINQLQNYEDLSLYYQYYSDEEIKKKRFYNIGAGLFKHEAWTNVDYCSEWYGKWLSENKVTYINFNLMECNPLPIEDNVANIIYCSHTIEHINDQAAQNLFNEAFKKLRTGGFLRLTCSDTDLQYKTIVNRDLHFWRDDIEYFKLHRSDICIPIENATVKQLFLWSIAAQTSILHKEESSYKISDNELDVIFTENSFEEALNFCTSRCNVQLQSKYAGNHINWWNKDKLKKMLKLAGFSDIYTSAFGQSMCPVLRNTTFFDSTYPHRSLYIEAKK